MAYRQFGDFSKYETLRKAMTSYQMGEITRGDLMMAFGLYQRYNAGKSSTVFYNPQYDPYAPQNIRGRMSI